VLTVTTLAPSSAYPDVAAGLALTDRILAAVRALPGVTRAGVVNTPPLSGTFNDSVIVAEGQTLKPGEAIMSPIYSAATPGYFEAMGIRLLSGRGFTEQDRRDSRRVIVIDQKLAERSWPGRDAVGRRMFQPQSPNLKTDERTQWLTVVGVVDTIRMLNLAGTDNAAGVYYFPFSQNFTRTFTVAIHTEGDAASLAGPVRTAVGKIDPALALFDVRTMADRAAGSLAARRAALMLCLGFGSVSLFLAAIGLYGVLSYLLAQRTREIGVRMAVGSTPAGVFGLFLKEGMALVFLGLAAGGALAVAGRGVIERFLYGVQPLEPVVLGAVTVTLAGIAFLAIAWPARQAARMNPTAALRAEG
jgi:predicted permease